MMIIIKWRKIKKGGRRKVDKKTSNIAPSSIGLFSKPVAWFTDFWEDAICFGTLVSGRI